MCSYSVVRGCVYARELRLGLILFQVCVLHVRVLCFVLRNMFMCLHITQVALF